MFEFQLKFHINLFLRIQLGQVMAGRRIGAKSLAESMLTYYTDICKTRKRWISSSVISHFCKYCNAGGFHVMLQSRPLLNLGDGPYGSHMGPSAVCCNLTEICFGVFLAVPTCSVTS